LGGEARADGSSSVLNHNKKEADHRANSVYQSFRTLLSASNKEELDPV
jgi:hypothetical protein